MKRTLQSLHNKEQFCSLKWLIPISTHQTELLQNIIVWVHKFHFQSLLWQSQSLFFLLFEGVVVSRPSFPEESINGDWAGAALSVRWVALIVEEKDGPCVNGGLAGSVWMETPCPQSLACPLPNKGVLKRLKHHIVTYSSKTRPHFMSPSWQAKWGQACLWTPLQWNRPKRFEDAICLTYSCSQEASGFSEPISCSLKNSSRNMKKHWNPELEGLGLSADPANHLMTLSLAPELCRL